jgi:hypothetical protein
MALEAALFVLIVALPLAFFPQSRDAFLDVKDPAARRRQAPEAWIRDQLATFPNDSVTVPAAEPGLTPPGLIDAVRRSLASAPRSERA